MTAEKLETGLLPRLRILHVFRAPVGGLFRHVRDLAEAQAAAGHEVGAICDTGDDLAAEERLADLAKHLSLGLHRMPILRGPNPGDIANIATVRSIRNRLQAHIVHGHGAKGGLFARLGNGGARVIYTPHGGSLHYDGGTFAGMLYLGAERMLRARTHAFAFESAYARDTFIRKVGMPDAPMLVVHNGLPPEEFEPLGTKEIHYDIGFVGELRHLKGLDTLFESLSLLAEERQIRALIAGDGPDEDYFRQRAGEMGLGSAVAFPGRMPAHDVFRQAGLIVLPSVNESLPYVAIEALAAGRPLIATNVGGIPEIFGAWADRLIPPGDVPALTTRIAAALDNPDAARTEAHEMSADIERRFSLARMVEGMENAYRLAFAESLPADLAERAGQRAPTRP